MLDAKGLGQTRIHTREHLYEIKLVKVFMNKIILIFDRQEGEKKSLPCKSHIAICFTLSAVCPTVRSACGFAGVWCHKIRDSPLPPLRRRYPERGLCVLERCVYAPGHFVEEGQLSIAPICLCCARETLADIRRYTERERKVITLDHRAESVVQLCIMDHLSHSLCFFVNGLIEIAY